MYPESPGIGDIPVATAARPRNIHSDSTLERCQTGMKYQWPRRLPRRPHHLAHSAAIGDVAASLREARFSRLEDATIQIALARN